jgi:uncharacterized protein YjbI with pentapeptide repeats
VSNTLSISSYEPLKNIKNLNNGEYAFKYNLLTANKDELQFFSDKWRNKEAVVSEIRRAVLGRDVEGQLRNITECVIENEQDKVTVVSTDPYLRYWPETREIRYFADLRGLKIFNAEIKYQFHSFDYVRLDFTLIENSKFIGGADIHKNFTGFYCASFNHASFLQCTFTDMHFGGGEYKYVVFSSCHFKNVKFGYSSPAIYSHILFQNCTFSNVDFERINISSFCFFGFCEFEDIKINIKLPYNQIAGADIISFMKKRDRETFRVRKDIKSWSGPADDPKYTHFKKGEKKRTGERYKFTGYLYQGLTSLYSNLAHLAENKGEYELSCVLRYNFLYCRDEICMGNQRFPELFGKNIRRNLFGYGYKYEKTLLFLIGFTVLMSLCYLFTGISYNGRLIQRTATLNFSEFKPTIIDWLRCYYFSVKATTSVGLSSLSPVSTISLILSIVNGLVGTVVYTIFIIIFSRRFFK